ncbi:MAG TPA: PEP-CTERM sorting domain-containing protein [Candidatus Acidoferrales bacterium]|nr:PEP-CTERM sorting domain-containing protein [Candidatus Acidoferrales bacterium]
MDKSMSKLASFTVRGLAVVTFLMFLGVCSAKADTVVCGANCMDNGSSFTWTGIVVTGQESSGEWPSTQSTDSVTLWYGGSGTEAVAITNCTANCGSIDSSSANPEGNNAAYALLYAPEGTTEFAIDSTGATTLAPPPSTVPCAENGAQCNFYDYSVSTVCWGDVCNSGPGSGTIKDFTLVALGSGDFAVQGNSISLTFSLSEEDPPATPTPEPSSLLLLGIGLSGLWWFGMRRQGIA